MAPRVIALLTYCAFFGGLNSAMAAGPIDLANKMAIRQSSADELAASVKAQVIAAREKAPDPKSANAGTEKIVTEVFSQLGNKDRTKVTAILAALQSIPGIDFVRMVTVAAEAQPLLTRMIEGVAKLLDPDGATAILASLNDSTVLNKYLGTGPGSSSVSANVAALTGAVQSDEQ